MITSLVSKGLVTIDLASKSLGSKGLVSKGLVTIDLASKSPGSIGLGSNGLGSKGLVLEFCLLKVWVLKV